MPPMRRNAKPRTVESVAEDLRFAREAGGLDRCDAARLAATVVLLGSSNDDDANVTLANARMLLATHLRKTCESALASSAGDPCARAAARSLHSSMLRAKGEDQKVASIRRAAILAAGCTLGLDGLRKREDALILRAAQAVHADLLQRERTGGFQTVEEAVRHSGPLIQTVHEELHEGLPLLYQLAPDLDERNKRGFMWNALLGVAAAMQHLHQIVELHARPGQHGNVDFLFADIAMHAMLVTFPHENDKATVRHVLASLARWEISEFIPAIHAHPEGLAFLDRWGEWIASCHPTCAYQRASVIRMYCLPHQLTTALEQFAENYRELLEGELEAFIGLELTGIRDPNQPGQIED